MSSSASNVNNAPSSTPYSAPPVIIAFTLGILICFFVSFFFIYLCRCCYVNVVHTWAFQRTASGNLVRLSPTASPYRGLDPSLLQIFPTFSYASVKELHGKEYSLECAICLLEFEDDSSLRLLTFCCHVFHQECIDLWLCSHKTCPVCRTDLESPTNQMHKCQESCEMHHEEEISREPLTENEIRIDVKEDESDTSERHEEAASCSQQVVEEQKRFSRSHSTGHSIVVTEGGHNQVRKDDKYTLRLPEQIGIKIIKRGGHKYTKSCATYKEMATLCCKCSIVEAISGCSSRGETERA